MEKRKCNRVFLNKKLKSKWVAREILDIIKAIRKITTNKIVVYIRQRFFSEIAFKLAYKARINGTLNH